MMDIYRYSPLNAERKEFRLMTLLPSSDSSDISITIDHTAFSPPEQVPHYEALSYVWGNVDSRKAITIVDNKNWRSREHPKCLMVTANLHDALQGLRHEQIPRFMWIDAICINQLDIEERSSQVSRMGEIYSHADQVII
jgi:hypothetical protein